MSSFALSLQEVGAKSGGGAAPGGASAGPPGAGFMQLLPLLMIVPLLFLMFRKQKKETEARASLKKGDTVVTNAGLIGELIDFDDKIAKVKIAPGTTVKMVSSTISPFVEEKAATDAKPAAEKK